MKSKQQAFTTGDNTDKERYISENKLAASDKEASLNERSTHDRQIDRNKENEYEKKLLNRDSGNVICVEDEQTGKSEADTVKSLQGKPLKHPLHRKSSNITNDSGRSTVSDICDHELETELPPDNVNTLGTNASESNRRESLTVTDSTGHLSLPSPLDCVNIVPHSVGTAQLHQKTNEQNDHVSDLQTNSHSTSSSPSCSRPGSGKRNAPKILYSCSEDSSLTHRRLSPYSSPTASPRLRRQPTMETRRISVSDGGDGFIQLNQYKLKDEIGKVIICYLSLLYCKYLGFETTCET